jgi:tol-pal system protein YbgF
MILTAKTNKWGYCLLAISLAFLVLGLTGCATKQDVLRVDENVRQLRNDQKLLKVKLDQIDSLFAAGADQDIQMRADIRSSLDEMNQQLLQMSNQLNDMQQMVYSLSQRTSLGPVTQQLFTEETPPDSAEPADTLSQDAASSVDCRKLWDNAFKDMYRSQFDLAISGFMDYLKFCPDTDLADNSQYWIAESYYEMKQHEQAIDEYKKLLDQYPESEKRASAYFKLGRTYEKLADTARALEYFTILENEFPGSVEYEQVKDKLEAWQKAEDD